MNDSPANAFRLLATAARIAGFPAGPQWPATLTLEQLAALLAGGRTGEQGTPFRDWCTALNLAAKSGALPTTLSQREAIPAVRRVATIGLIGRAAREFVPPPAPRFRDVPTVTRTAAGDWLQGHPLPLPLTVVAWLASADVPTHPPATEPSTRPEPRHRWQEDEVLRAIAELGYEPRALPKRLPGRPGAKAQARKKLSLTGCVFDKAWERLRKDNRIRDAD